MSEGLSNQERGEQLRIGGFIIPADPDIAIQQTELTLHDLNRRQEIVGGYIEAVNLAEPAATLYINEEGKLHGLGVNVRATALVWMHNPAFRNVDIICGDALLIGPPDRAGEDTAVPDALTALLAMPGKHRVDLRFAGTERWHGDTSVFDNWYTAYVRAFQLEQDLPGVEAIRVTAVGHD